MPSESPHQARERSVGGTTVVELHGEMDILTAPPLAAYLDALTAVPGCDLVLDLQYLSFIDCSGISVLCRTRRRVRERQGRLALVVRDPRIRGTLRIAGVLGVFDVLDSVPGTGPECDDAAG